MSDGQMAVKYDNDAVALGPEVAKPLTIGWCTSEDIYSPLIEVMADKAKIVIHAAGIRRVCGVPSDTPIEVL